MLLNGNRITRNPKKVAHYYQTEAVEATERSWTEDSWDKSLIIIPTGGGKSFVTGELCAREIEEDGRCLFLAHTKELVTAPRNAFEEDFGCQATIEMAEQKADDSPMVFASVPTMVNRIKKGLWRPDTFQKIIVDESHRILAAGHTFIAEFFGQEDVKIAGCTASPRRGDKKDLLQFFDGICYDIGLDRLIKEGYLAGLDIQEEPLNIMVHGESKTGDITDEEAASAIEPYLEKAADLVVLHGKGRCGLSFLPLRKTAMIFCRMLRDRGVKAEYVAGEGGVNGVSVQEQKQIKRSLEMGQTEMVVQAAIWGEGVDIRPLNFGVDLRPTRSWTAHLQKYGRFTRTYDPSAPYALKGSLWPKKDKALILDFCFASDDHNLLMRPSAIFAKDDDEARAIDNAIRKNGGKPKDLLEAVAQAKSEHEERLRARLEATAKRKARFINADDFLLQMHHPELAEYEALNPNEARPIKGSLSEKQMNWLIKSRFDLESIKNYGHAKHLLNSLGERAKAGLSTVGQISCAVSLGMDKDAAYAMPFKDISVWIDSHAPKPSWKSNWKGKH